MTLSYEFYDIEGQFVSGPHVADCDDVLELCERLTVVPLLPARHWVLLGDEKRRVLAFRNVRT